MGGPDKGRGVYLSGMVPRASMLMVFSGSYSFFISAVSGWQGGVSCFDH
jgi:hypothetical protein